MEEAVTEEDVQGMMEVSYGLEKKPVDLIIHSPGGSPEAAEGIVEYKYGESESARTMSSESERYFYDRDSSADSGGWCYFS